MNGNARIFWRTGRAALLSGATAALAGCATRPGARSDASGGVDPASPAAAQVAAAARRPGPAPLLSDIPPAPTDVRAPSAWRAAIEDQEAEGVFIRRSVAEGAWTLADSEAFAVRARAEIEAAGLRPPTDAEIAESEAFARAMRKRAIPPPSRR